MQYQLRTSQLSSISQHSEEESASHISEKSFQSSQKQHIRKGSDQTPKKNSHNYSQSAKKPSISHQPDDYQLTSSKSSRVQSPKASYMQKDMSSNKKATQKSSKIYEREESESEQQRSSQDKSCSIHSSADRTPSKMDSRSPIDQISPRFGITNKREYWDPAQNQPQQEKSVHSPDSLRTADLLRQGSSATMMKRLMTSESQLFSSPASLRQQKSGESTEEGDLREECRRLLDETYRKENELGKLSSENEVLKNDKALLLSEYRKANYMYETQKSAKEEARKALKEAQNEVFAAHDAFHAKITILQRMVQNAFKGIDLFEPDDFTRSRNGTHQESFYKRVREVERCFDEALNDHKIRNQNTENNDQRRMRQELNNTETEEGYERYERIEYSEARSPTQQDAIASGELYELKRRLIKQEKMLEEKDRRYDELYQKYEDMKAHFRQKHEENKVHVKVIERNLDSLLTKLEKEFSEEEQRIISFIETNLQIKLDENYLEVKRKNEVYFKKVDIALKACLETISKAKRKIKEINSQNGDLKNWLEMENQSLRDGLSMALEQNKMRDSHTETMREALERFLRDAGDAMMVIENRNGKRQMGQDQVVVEETLKNAIHLLRTFVEVGSMNNGYLAN